MRSPMISLTSLAALIATAAASTLSRRGTFDLNVFEQRFVSSLDHQYTLPSHTGSKLIGYKTIPIHEHERADFEESYKSNSRGWESLTNTYYDPEGGFMRVYFPVHGGIVAHAGGRYEANQFGEVNCDFTRGDHDIKVLGRNQTSDITGVEGNIIKDGIIYLSTPPSALRRIGDKKNVFVFDFGLKEVLHHHDHDHDKRSDGKVSCMNNHGGPNCSNKFGINNSNKCGRPGNKCIDYNGWFTDCVDGKKSNFPGSDCFTALARGQCWNEIM